MLPTPESRPYPQLLWGAGAPKAIRRAARMGLSFACVGGRKEAEIYIAALKAAGQTQPEGIAELPADVKLAATELVALRYRQSKRWGDTGFGMGTERVNYFMGDMAPATKSKLSGYRAIAPVET